MLGYPLHIEKDGLAVTLRSPTEDDLTVIVKGFASQRIHLYTLGQGAPSLEKEKEWLSKSEADQNGRTWVIEVDNKAIGVTGIHGMDLSGSCESGIIIWDQDYWHKGVASCSHLMRTFYAADFLNRFTIRSHARTVNPGSVNALKRVGYAVTGIQPKTHFKAGEYLDTYVFTWWHPERISLLFKEGLPKEYEEAVSKAQATLDLARQLVSY